MLVHWTWQSLTKCFVMVFLQHCIFRNLPRGYLAHKDKTDHWRLFEVQGTDVSWSWRISTFHWPPQTAEKVQFCSETVCSACGPEGYFLVPFWVWQKQLWGDTRIWEGTLKFQVLSFPLLPPCSLLSLFSLFFSFLSSFFGLSCLSQLCPYSFPLPFLLCCSSGVFSRAFLLYCLSDVAPVCIYLQLLVNVNCKFEK